MRGDPKPAAAPQPEQQEREVVKRQNADHQFQCGQVVWDSQKHCYGQITKIMDYGAVIEVNSGIERWHPKAADLRALSERESNAASLLRAERERVLALATRFDEYASAERLSSESAGSPFDTIFKAIAATYERCAIDLRAALSQPPEAPKEKP
jgi:hypothetical protein